MSYAAKADKVMLLGIDGMDPRITKKMLAEGIMPNLEKFIARGAAKADLVMLGGHPTVTPPMWTTLATGAYPITHGITCFFRQSPRDLDYLEYNLDSRNCQAEPLWNVLAEAGKKTIVWQWPGSSWPPTSDNRNLAVVDGTSPGTPNSGIAKMDSMFIEVASTETTDVIYKEKLSSDGHIPCVIDDLKQMDEINVAILEKLAVTTEPVHNIILTEADGEAGLSQTPYNGVASPIKQAAGWISAPEDAKEFTILFSQGLVRRPALILKNAEGIYDRIAVYRSKKAAEPLYTLRKGVYEKQLLDEAIKEDQTYQVSRDMRILELAEDGTYLKMWVSDGLDIANDVLWQPKELYSELIQRFGYLSTGVTACGPNKQLLLDCMLASWEAVGDWQAEALKYVIREKGYEAVFSHYHNVDCFGHAIWKHIKKKADVPLSEDDVEEIIRALYAQTDRYIAQYLPLLDEGWTIMIVSDHGQICPEYKPLGIGDDTGVNVRVMQELGFTTVKTDADGKELYEIDWEQTKAIAIRGNHIYINLKGRDPHGIVDLKDKYELEEEIMTALYGYKHPESGRRIIALALRNKDAVILGMGGPECGDIIYFNAEGYNYDHVDSLSTTYGCGETSVSPIFIAAGKGIKQGFTTTRWIREVDVAPTAAALLGVRMPNECEGAPIYQIMEK